MGLISRLWGLAGVVVLLVSAVWRLMPGWNEAGVDHGAQTYIALGLLLPTMLYIEGYRGFYRGFAPRVVSRSKALADLKSWPYQLLAPLFCMGFIGSYQRRKVIVWIITMAIVGLVVWVKGLPQPWRWVIDLSVAVALLAGVLSVVWLAYRDWSREGYLCDPEIPSI